MLSTTTVEQRLSTPKLTATSDTGVGINGRRKTIRAALQAPETLELTRTRALDRSCARHQHWQGQHSETLFVANVGQLRLRS